MDGAGNSAHPRRETWRRLVAMKPTYTVEVRRSGRWWAINVPEVKGVFSQARRLSEVEAMARDAIAAVIDVSPRSFALVIRPVLNARLQALVDAARRSRISVQEAQLEAAENAALALRSLQREGLALRDAGELLGISHQRAAQIMGSDLRMIRSSRRKAIAELRVAYTLHDEPSRTSSRTSLNLNDSGVPFRPTKAFYSPREVAEVAGLHPSTILNYIKAGKLYAVKVSSRKYRIPGHAAWLLLDPGSVPPPKITIREDIDFDIRDADREPDLNGPWKPRAD